MLLLLIGNLPFQAVVRSLMSTMKIMQRGKSYHLLLFNSGKNVLIIRKCLLYHE